MTNRIQKLEIRNFYTEVGSFWSSIPLSYQCFGRPLGTAPVVLVNHALTGNSQVSGIGGWWNEIIGDQKLIDTLRYSVLSFNIPGNGYDGFLVDDYEKFVARDIAKLFLKGLNVLGISQLYAIIGGSLGGGIAWEMVIEAPKLTTHLIPIASDWKATDWLIAHCAVQEQLLLNSTNPVHDARMHAMLCYRTPASFKQRFQRSKQQAEGIFSIEHWLQRHGEKLKGRFQLGAYLLMNQLLKTIDVTRGRNDAEHVLASIEAHVHIIAIPSDLFFISDENKATCDQLAKYKRQVSYYEIDSIHGHDAFLIEFQQLIQCLSSVFESKDELKQKSKSRRVSMRGYHYCTTPQIQRS